MAGVLAIVALVGSALLLAVAVAALVLLRRGEGPTYGASRAYDANLREAVRLLTGEVVDRPTGEQWYEPSRKEPRPGDPAAGEFRDAVAEALSAIVPSDRDLAFDGDVARMAGAVALPALSTADLREAGLESRGEGDELVIGVVLFNPEPPGGEAGRVALPVQALFPALRRAGRPDLIRRFEVLREGATGKDRDAG